MINDVRYALRNLRLTPGLTATIILTLALGIGANTAIFSIVNTLLFAPLPYPHADRLMAVTFASAERLGDRLWPYPKYAAFARHQATFDVTAAYGSRRLTAVTGDLPVRLEAEVVTASYFPMLGIAPAHGRIFTPDEDRDPGQAPVVILSDALWRQFGADAQVVGKTLTINGRPYEVIGVMPPAFRGQSGTAELWITAMASEHAIGKGTATSGGWWWMGVIARLKPGVTPVQAAAEMPMLQNLVDQTFMARMSPDEERYQLVPLKALKVHPEVSRSFVLLLAAVGFVLLIACANSASLMLGRAIARQKDFALRRALGAGRGVIIRQVIIESLLVAFTAGAVGLLVALWGLDWLTTARPSNTTGFWAEYVRTFEYFNVRLESRVLAFNFAVALTVGFLFGLAPAWQAARSELNDVLKQGAGTSAAAFEKAGGLTARGVLVLAEIALSLVLLIGAGLMVKSFVRAAEAELGLNPDGVTTMTVAPTGRKAPAFYYDLLARLQALPGVEHAALSSATPMGPAGWQSGLTVDGRPADANNVRASVNVVTPGFMAAHGMRISSGRGFTDSDTAGARVAIVTRAFAEAAWPGQSAIGRRVRQEGQWHQVVGISENAVLTTLEDPAPSVFYVPVRREGDGSFMAPTNISIRTTVDPVAMAKSIQAQVRALDATAPVFNVVTMRERVDRVTARYRYSAVLLSALAALALLLAAMGTYGVIAYAVTARTREIGIRMALGARPRDVMQLVVGGGLRLALAGIVVGLGCAYASARLLSALLYGVTHTDAATFIAIAVLMAAVAALASYLPARRAMRVDPVVALRAE